MVKFLRTAVRYFIFFVLGTIVKYKYNEIKRMVENNLFSTSIILAFIGVTIFLETRAIQSYYYRLVFQTIQSFSGVLFIFMFFEKNQKWCSHETKVGRALQYVGKRTLDIYLIHYFFLPSNLLMLGKFFTDYPNPTVEFFVSMFLALLVLSLCLVTSNLLRCSDFLTEWLFGRKKEI
ncbi:acyltransferase family protein [Barnesiella sp. An55]|uniref:acyltransferase family protein n=1 Tax=Barnesiella sp. An55 TaxID=1965646 RepID=UPI001302E988|nr:acyltransferase family protein [Barnesiella sp. An55]